MSPDEFGLDEFESLVYEAFSLILERNVGMDVSLRCEPLVIKEFAKAYKMDFLWLYSVCKILCDELNRAKD